MLRRRPGRAVSLAAERATDRRRGAASRSSRWPRELRRAEVLTDPGLGGLGGDAVAPTGKHLATSFSGHGTGTVGGAVAGDLHQIVADPYKIADSAVPRIYLWHCLVGFRSIDVTEMWAKLMTDVAVAANFGVPNRSYPPIWQDYEGSCDPASSCEAQVVEGLAELQAASQALILTFLGAAYHAYGYVQLRNAQKQAAFFFSPPWSFHALMLQAFAPGNPCFEYGFYGYVHFEPDWTRYGTFTRVRKIAKAIHGVVDSYAWRRSGADQDQHVIVKRMPGANVHQNETKWPNDMLAHFNPRDANVPYCEDALTEIGVFSYLRRQPDVPQYLLKMIGAFTDGPGGPNRLLVTEYGGNESFTQVQTALISNEEHVIQRLMWQLLQAVRYLHHHGIGHRDISLENLLISMPAGEEPSIRLMDFGQAVRTHSRCGTVRQRYFGFVGKPYYRGPECYLPRRPQVRVIAPDGAVADEVHFLENLNAAGQPDGYLCEVQMPHGVVPGQPCDAELAGYEAPPLDIFSCGVCLFILAWRLPPWSQALRSDPSFQYIQAHGIPQLLTHWRQRLLSAEAMNLLNQMVRCSADPRRVDASGRHGQTGRVGLFLHTVDGQPAISTFPSTREVAESVSSRFEIEKGGKEGQGINQGEMIGERKGQADHESTIEKSVCWTKQLQAAHDDVPSKKLALTSE
ncbi:Serine/threonine-protein kinase nak1 (N-rich kinase 1) [Durusdinium trenchii]|uniref:Serine/threonine-protein kinase nak1 (N-rich kinase 1) n=1 Tax=Durusdinium trenchii TaxID=1381693 RepID=A0ABP0NHP1_9DINO